MPNKGKLKRRQAGTQFKKNQTPPPARWPRRHAAEDDAIPGPSSAPEVQPHQPAEELQGPNLRPRNNLKKTEITKTKPPGNRIVDLTCLLSTMNSVLQDHQKFPTHCESINLIIHNERSVGLGSDLQFACKSCRFVSTACRTYQSRVGRTKGAAINMLLAAGLLSTSISVEQGNILLVSMGIPPPSRSHLQNLVGEASKMTIDLNERDMAEKRQRVVQQNEAQGAADPRQIDLSFDVRYNANRMTSSYKPGQSSSQAYGVAIENHTSFKYVVGLAIENKLCWTGAYLRNKGFDVTCPGGHADCTANKEYMEPHSERSIANSIASQMHEDDLIIRTLTTDGDTKSSLGVQDFYDQLGVAWSVTRQADSNHIGSSQIRRIRKANWSAAMFPGKTTKVAKQQAIAAFARDVKARCSKIIQTLRSLGGGDITKMIKRLPEVRQATVECYAGNCSVCPHQSLVCKGVGGLGDWWFHSEFLPTHGIHSLKMTRYDKELLATILEVRLSENAVRSVASNTSTQKNEAFNRGVSSVLPKEVNYSKNFAGKLASKTLQLNNSLESAVEAKVAAITGQELSPRASRYLRYCTKREEKRKRRQKSPASKAKRRARRADLEHRYSVSKSGAVKNREQLEYVKGQLDNL